jgi:hypothetical protein
MSRLISYIENNNNTVPQFLVWVNTLDSPTLTKTLKEAEEIADRFVREGGYACIFQLHSMCHKEVLPKAILRIQEVLQEAKQDQGT